MAGIILLLISLLLRIIIYCAELYTAIVVPNCNICNNTFTTAPDQEIACHSVGCTFGHSNIIGFHVTYLTRHVAVSISLSFPVFVWAALAPSKLGFDDDDRPKPRT